MRLGYAFSALRFACVLIWGGAFTNWALADVEKIHTYLQSLHQQQSISGEELQDDKSDIIKEYDRLVKSPEARRELEKQNPGLVAARDQAIVELRREKLQKETAEKPHRVARMRR